MPTSVPSYKIVRIIDVLSNKLVSHVKHVFFPLQKINKFISKIRWNKYKNKMVRHVNIYVFVRMLFCLHLRKCIQFIIFTTLLLWIDHSRLFIFITFTIYLYGLIYARLVSCMTWRSNGYKNSVLPKNLCIKHTFEGILWQKLEK